MCGQSFRKRKPPPAIFYFYFFALIHLQSIIHALLKAALVTSGNLAASSGGMFFHATHRRTFCNVVKWFRRSSWTQTCYWGKHVNGAISKQLSSHYFGKAVLDWAWKRSTLIAHLIKLWPGQTGKAPMDLQTQKALTLSTHPTGHLWTVNTAKT